jgi:hypothetical protein
MEQSHSWEANSHWASQEIHHLLWNPKVYHHVHKSPPLLPALDQMFPIHTFSHLVSLRSNLISSSHLRLGLLSGLPLSYSDQNFVCISPMRATCPAYHIVIDLITLIFGQAYKLWNSSLCSVLKLPGTSSLWGPDILLSTLFLNTLNLCSSLSVTEFHTHTGYISQILRTEEPADSQKCIEEIQFSQHEFRILALMIIPQSNYFQRHLTMLKQLQQNFKWRLQIRA